MNNLLDLGVSQWVVDLLTIAQWVFLFQLALACLFVLAIVVVLCVKTELMRRKFINTLSDDERKVIDNYFTIYYSNKHKTLESWQDEFRK